MSECPFDVRLARTPYLVLPKLALQAMPIHWRLRFDAMLDEMAAAGIDSTPAYVVFRDHDLSPPGDIKDVGTYEHPFWKIMRQPNDPWANYRRGNIEELLEHPIERQGSFVTRCLQALAEPFKTWHHRKRQTSYLVMTQAARLQIDKHTLHDGTAMTVYLGEDGAVWVRETEEFLDGRFTQEAAP